MARISTASGGREGVERERRGSVASGSDGTARGVVRISRNARRGASARRSGSERREQPQGGVLAGKRCFWGLRAGGGETHLHEADVLGVLAEALPADVQVVLANDTPLVRAHAAVEERGEGGGRLGMPTSPTEAQAETLKLRVCVSGSRAAPTIRDRLDRGRSETRVDATCPVGVSSRIAGTGRRMDVGAGRWSRKLRMKSTALHPRDRPVGKSRGTTGTTRTSDAGPCRCTRPWWPRC